MFIGFIDLQAIAVEETLAPDEVTEKNLPAVKFRIH